MFFTSGGGSDRKRVEASAVKQQRRMVRKINALYDAEEYDMGAGLHLMVDSAFDRCKCRLEDRQPVDIARRPITMLEPVVTLQAAPAREHFRYRLMMLSQQIDREQAGFPDHLTRSGRGVHTGEDGRRRRRDRADGSCGHSPPVPITLGGYDAHAGREAGQSSAKYVIGYGHRVSPRKVKAGPHPSGRPTFLIQLQL